MKFPISIPKPANLSSAIPNQDIYFQQKCSVVSLFPLWLFSKVKVKLWKAKITTDQTQESIPSILKAECRDLVRDTSFISNSKQLENDLEIKLRRILEVPYCNFWYKNTGMKMAQVIFNVVNTSERNFCLNQYIIFKSNLVSKKENENDHFERSLVLLVCLTGGADVPLYQKTLIWTWRSTGKYISCPSTHLNWMLTMVEHWLVCFQFTLNLNRLQYCFCLRLLWHQSCCSRKLNWKLKIYFNFILSPPQF